MVKFDYTAEGRIVGVRDTFAAFNEPSALIPPAITAITVITDGMVAGQRIDDATVCHPLLEVLAFELPTGAPALALLLERRPASRRCASGRSSRPSSSRIH